jgi:translin
MELDRIHESLRDELDAKNKAREKGLPLCRNSIRHSANAIRAVHRGEKVEAERLMQEARACLDEADAAMAAHPDIRQAGFFHDAAKEYAEARLTHALVFDLAFPMPAEIKVEAPAYLNGMGEAIGEVRRYILDVMRHGRLQRAEELLGAMDEIYFILTSMDYPDAMTGGLRRTTDVARSIMERTRGDVTTTLIQEALRKALEESREIN